MEYILDPEKGGASCIFCAKPQEKNDKENLILFRGTRNFVIMNLYPYSNGHLMVVPYEHTSDLGALDTETITDMMKITQNCLARLRTVMSPDGFNIGINLGKVSGAGIDEHVHLHIVPRWSGDTNFMPVVAETKVMPEHIRETYDQLVKVFRETK